MGANFEYNELRSMPYADMPWWQLLVGIGLLIAFFWIISHRD
jgi:hypothetical protein